MARRYYSSNAVASTLSIPLNNVDTSVSIALTAGWPTSYPFTIIIDDSVTGKEEICTVNSATSGAGTLTFSVTRGVDGSSGVSHSAGATVKHGVSARDFDEPNAHVNASSGVHGLTGDVVGTSDTQTLTNKTLTSPNVNTALNLGAGAGIVFEGSTDDAFETTLTVTDPTADRTVTIPNATTTLVGTDTSQTLTNKTISGASNTISNVSLTSGVTGTLPVANGGTGVTTSTGSGSNVLNNGSTLIGPSITTGIFTSSASFSIASSNATTVDIGGAATTFNIGAATGNTFVKNTLNVAGAANITGNANVTGDVNLGFGSVVVFEGSSDDTFETTLTVANPTADRTVTIPDATTTLVGTDTAQTLTNKTISGSSNTLVNVSLTGSVTGTLPVGNGGTGSTTASGARTSLGAAASGSNSDITALTGIPAWTSYTPTWTGSSSNPVLNNGTAVGAYMTIGKTLFFRASITAGSTTTFGSGFYSISLPSGFTSVNAAQSVSATFNSAGNTYAASGLVQANGTTVARIRYNNGALTSTAPGTFANGDIIVITGMIEVQ